MSKAFLPLYTGDFFSDTRGLTTFQKGAYLMLIFHYWDTGSLPTDERVLARIAGIDPRLWKKWRPTLAQFFQISAAGEWKHKRVEKELLKLQKCRSDRAQKRNEINDRRSIYHNQSNNKSTSLEIRERLKQAKKAPVLEGFKLPPDLLKN